MFDDVGDSRQRGGRRHLVALLMSAAANGTLVWGLWMLERPAETTLLKPDIPIEFPGPDGGMDGDQAGGEEPAPAPEPPTTPPEGPTVAPPEVAKTAPRAVVEDADEAVVADTGPPEAGGSVAGSGQGEAEPAGGGLGVGPGDGSFTVDSDDVKVRHRVYPTIPWAARKLEGGEHRCIAEISIDEAGEPYDVVVRECADSLSKAAERAVWKWRFHPLVVGGEPRRANFELHVVFRL